MNRAGSMNRLSRLIGSQAVNGWVAVGKKLHEQSKGRGGISSAVALFLLSPSIAQAAPVGGQVVSGPGSISQSGVTITVTQSAQNLSLTWKSFNIAPQEVVNYCHAHRHNPGIGGEHDIRSGMDRDQQGFLDGGVNILPI